MLPPWLADGLTDALSAAPAPYMALGLAAIIFAGFLRGFIGFGAALVSVPVISLILGPLAAVAVVTVMGLPSTLQLLPDAIRQSERPIVLPMALAIFATAPLGTWVLVSVSPDLMKIVISAAVVIMVAFLSLGWRLKQQVDAWILVAAGTIGGLVQGAAGIGGPPVVAVALSRSGSPERQRGNVLGVMTAIAWSSVPPLYYHGLFTPKTILIGLLLVPPYAIGTWVGRRYFFGAGKSYFRNAALAILALIGLTTLAIAFYQYLT